MAALICTSQGKRSEFSAALTMGDASVLSRTVAELRSMELPLGFESRRQFQNRSARITFRCRRNGLGRFLARSLHA